ncbi:MAG: T9SS C-terminal target domain-containing protein [Candidatus Latescibacterota bacterium]|jgi:hypothetical protein|nr:MAG: T9SS C-terminal target domain-containing protein [Candidatus Latescibacterota bacterium]
MKRKWIALLAPLLVALPAFAGPDPVMRGASIGRSGSGLSLVAGKKLSTVLGGGVPAHTFSVSLSSPSKDDPADREALKTDRPAPERTGIEAPYPNPTNPAVSIPFALAGPSHVRLDVYAVNGELVRVLVNEARSAGEYSAQWDGRNERGAEVSSGIYFARLEAGGRLFTRKIVVAR